MLSAARARQAAGRTKRKAFFFMGDGFLTSGSLSILSLVCQDAAVVRHPQILVFRRGFGDAVDDQNTERELSGFELESQLLLQSGKQRWRTLCRPGQIE